MARPKRADMNDVNRRRELISAAAKLFKEQGFHATTTRDIAKAANMQSGSPFYHFANKQELLFAGVETSLLDCLAALEAVDPHGQSALDYFRALTRLHLERLLDDSSGVVPMVVDEWKHLDGGQRAQVIAIRDRFEELWHGAFTRIQEAGVTPDATPLAVTFFLSAMQGVVNWYRPEGRFSVDQIADQLVAFATCTSAHSDPKTGPSSARRKARNLVH